MTLPFSFLSYCDSEKEVWTNLVESQFEGRFTSDDLRLESGSGSCSPLIELKVEAGAGSCDAEQWRYRSIGAAAVLGNVELRSCVAISVGEVLAWQVISGDVDDK